MRPTLLLTRPQAASDRFATAAQEVLGADCPVLIAPLMQTVWQGDLPDLADIRDVIFTSEAALRGFCRLSGRRDMRAWCVGARTAAAARGAGFDVCQGPGDAVGLAALINAAGPGHRYVWPRGTYVARDIADLLISAGTETVSAVIYDQRALPLTVAAQDLLSRPDPVLLPLFSPRSARLFLSATEGAIVNAPLYLASLGPEIDAAAAPLTARQRRIATRPDADALLAALADLAEIAALG
jgi:uroporphyrinogen-III synthase